MILEEQILGGILFNEEFARKVIPFLKTDYFRNGAQRAILQLTQAYLDKYNRMPNLAALSIELGNSTDLNQKEYDEALGIIGNLRAFDTVGTDFDWLADQTESFCQDRAVYNAIMESVQILEEKSNQGRGAIPKILQDALGVSFDNAIGHDYLEDASARFDFYHTVEERIPFDLEYFNKITGGGLPRRTLSVVMAATGVGKTLAMCHFAAANLMAGKNVLYITLEMAQERISERIDCNLLNLSVTELETLPKDDFVRKFSKLRERVSGKLIVKEFPTSSANAAHFRHLLNELKLKKNFVPDVIYVDYLNICASSRVKLGNSVNSYTLVKSIAEELRALAMEFNVAIISATQTNRSGFDSSDVDMADVSESAGLPMTVDFMFAIMNTDELKKMGQMLVKQLKNRFRDVFLDEKFVIGVERSKFRLHDVEQAAQRGLSRPAETQMSEPSVPLNTFGHRETGRKDFGGFDFG